MTWHAAIMPDDALDPDSLVGRMLNPEAKPIQWPEVKWQASPLAAEQAPQVFEVTLPPPTTVEPLATVPSCNHPLWANMEAAFLAGRQGFADHLGDAAEIEALRDYIVPEESEPWLADSPESMNSLAITAMYTERQRLRAALTEQARIARQLP